ncbi:MAG: hypothetical protein J5U17_12935, partial [Candidatus Methanoperedens sp.]|nr:hypothetical protein [Candidatus Methanoperedens sp.]
FSSCMFFCMTCNRTFHFLLPSSPGLQASKRKANMCYTYFSPRLIIRNGDMKNITITLSKIVSIERPYIDSFEIGVEGKQKVQVFSVSDPQMWNIFIKIAIEKSK